MSLSSKTSLGRKMKARAPPPPPAPQPGPRNTVPDGGGTAGMDSKENLLRPTVDLQLTLPQGYQTSVREDGSKALMDLLVELCSRHHLNPSLHQLELLSPEGHPLGFKPNVRLGSLNVARVLIKEKVSEEKAVRKPAPKVPEKTVRLMVNYHGSQKAVVRVNPLAPLDALIPVICEKCEFDPSHVLLLKDNVGCQKLPLDKSLTQLGVKELYVFDQSRVLRPKMASTPALNYSDSISSSTSSLSRGEKRGILGFFQFSRRKSKGVTSVSGVSSSDRRFGTSVQSLSVTDVSRTSPKFDSKKRRAPAPPVALASPGHNSFESYQIGHDSESLQRKRKAPAPPPTPAASDDTSISAARTPDSCATQTPTPTVRAKTERSAAQTAKTNPKIKATGAASSKAVPSSPCPSSTTTTDSLAVQDSSSEVSRSLGESDLDSDQTPSHCSTLTSSTASGSARARTESKSFGSRMTDSDKSGGSAADPNREASSASASGSETESALNVKVEEVENNRQSTMAWLRSDRSSAAKGRTQETGQVEETASLGSSSSSSSTGSSLPDQGYGASEGTAEGDDSGVVSSPSVTQPTSPDAGSFLESGGRDGGVGLPEPTPDSSSESDEGCSSWGSKHRNIRPQAKAERFKNNNEDKPEFTAQLHQTLAKLDSDLADFTEVPVSLVDLDVPVTAIDEVLEYNGADGKYGEKLLTGTETSRSKGPKNATDLQNRNNNARTVANSKKSRSANGQLSKPEQQRVSQEIKTLNDKTAEKILVTGLEKTTLPNASSVKEDKSVKSSVKAQKHKTSQDKPDSTKRKEENKHVTVPAGQTSHSKESEATQNVYRMNASSNASRSKITQNHTSRFGTKTFTVVPPKPSATPAATGQASDPGTAGALKIDEQGNIMKAGGELGGPAESDLKCTDSHVFGKAKAFWSSSERRESAAPPGKGVADKGIESRGDRRGSSGTGAGTASNKGDVKTPGSVNGSAERAPAEERTKKGVQDPVKDVKLAKAGEVDSEGKISASRNVQQPSDRAAVSLPLSQDTNKDLPFFKPSRRTSSQYVASAINKYTPNISSKASSVPHDPEPSASLKTQSAGFQRSSQTVLVNPRKSRSSSDKKGNGFESPNPAGCDSSQSYPDNMSKSQRDTGTAREANGGFGHCVETTKDSSNMPATATDNNKPFRFSGRAQNNITTTDERGNKCIRGDTSFPSSAKSSTASKGRESNARDAIKASTAPDEKLEPAPNMSDSGIVPGPPPATVFGPVKKFKPVICRSVEKETSLHSNLMEAIQTGGGRERLKKTSASSASGTKKASVLAEENEKTALLAAIRAQGNFGRLRKTKSEAAAELEKFRKVVSKEKKHGEDSPSSFSPPSVTHISSVSNRETPAPLVAPPPPPPLLPQVATAVAKPSGNASTNPALAREALLEAIRSGSAAEKLKKVAVPAKTIRVNGRLGTIRATTTTLQQQ